MVWGDFFSKRVGGGILPNLKGRKGGGPPQTLLQKKTLQRGVVVKKDNKNCSPTNRGGKRFCLPFKYWKGGAFHLLGEFFFYHLLKIYFKNPPPKFCSKATKS